jgi:hypothetical protein
MNEQSTKLATDLPREKADQILFLIILDVENHVLKSIRESRSDRKGLFHITDAHTDQTSAP